MDEFEKLLEEVRVPIERFVRYRLPSQTDAEDVLQEVYLTAYQRFSQLQNKDSFKAWIISIARNKCNDYFRRAAAHMEISIEDLVRKELAVTRRGISLVHTVRETLELLGDRDKQILYLFFWKEMPQAEIAKQLNIPLGTVKSRLYKAKQHFKDKYPYSTTKPKGEHMKSCRKLLAVVLAVMLLASLGTAAFASSEEPAGKVITAVSLAEKDANYVDSALYSQYETVTFSDGTSQTIDAGAQTFILVRDGAVVDLNGLQIDGAITEVMNPTPHDKKFEAFGWEVISIDGHNFDEIAAAFERARTVKGKPTAIIARTVKGKGVSYMENACEWHGQAPKEDLYRVAISDLTAIEESLR